MLRFNIGRIPVEVHFSHALISVLLAFSFAQGFGDANSWPGAIVADPKHPQHQLTMALVVALWTVMISVSVLLHELGHAVAGRLFGYATTVHLVGLGGLTRAEHAENMPWHKDVLFTLAGPGAGLLLGVGAGLLSFGLQATGHQPEGVRYVLQGLLWANVFWSVLNMVPLTTLDGGRVAAAVLVRAFGRPGFLVAQVMSLALGGAALAWALSSQQLFMAMLVGLLLFRTVAAIGAYNRGELPLGQAAHPMVAVLKQAEVDFTNGDLASATRGAESVLRSDAPTALRSRAHLVLGWVGLKENRGRQALDHFSQVQGPLVPTHAQAAGYSLIGDEARAIPLWQEAVRENPGDVVLLHEFAGALLRAGRESDVRQLPGVRLATAWLAAERVYSLRGEHTQAAHAAEHAFQEEPSATLAYNAACDFALGGQPDDALRMLALASQNGFRDGAHALGDADLASLRSNPRFQAWLGQLEDNAAATA